MYNTARYKVHKIIFNKKRDYFENKLNDCIGKPKELWKALTLLRIGFFGAGHGWGGGGGKKAPLPKICHTYPTMMKLGTVIPYLKKIQKIYESRDTPLEFC